MDADELVSAHTRVELEQLYLGDALPVGRQRSRLGPRGRPLVLWRGEAVLRLQGRESTRSCLTRGASTEVWKADTDDWRRSEISENAFALMDPPESPDYERAAALSSYSRRTATTS